MKRIFPSEIWDEEWFQELPQPAKLAFIYGWTHCDHAGVWNTNLRLAKFRAGELEWEGLVRGSKGACIVLANGNYWFRDFIKIVWGGITERNNVHRQISASLKENSVPFQVEDQSPSEGASKPPGQVRLGQGQVEPEGVQREPIRGSAYPQELWDHAEFRRAFADWEDHKADKGHIISRGERQSALTACHQAGPMRAIAVIRAAISNGWGKLVWDFDQRGNGNGSHGTKRTAFYNARNGYYDKETKQFLGQVLPQTHELERPHDQH